MIAGLYGESPDLHLVLVERQLARLGRLSEEDVVERLSELGHALDEARRTEGLEENGEDAVYPLDPDMLEASGSWRVQTRRPPFGRRGR